MASSRTETLPVFRVLKTNGCSLKVSSDRQLSRQIESLQTEQLLMPPGLVLQGGPWELESREGREYERSVGMSPKAVIEIPW